VVRAGNLETLSLRAAGPAVLGNPVNRES